MVLGLCQAIELAVCLIFLFKAEQPQLSQPVLIGEVFQPPDHFCGPPLDPLQQVHVFPVLRAPELDAVLQVGSHQSAAEGQNHLPRPAGYISFDAAQDMAGFLGCERTLLARVQLFTHQYPQVLLCRAALNPFIPQPVLILGVALTQVQDLALGLVEPHEVHVGRLLELVQVPLDGIPSLRVQETLTNEPLFPTPVVFHGVAVAQVQDLALGLVEPHTIGLSPSIQPVQVPLQSLPTLKQINTPTQLGVVCKLTEGAPDPLIHIVDKDIKSRLLPDNPIPRRVTGYLDAEQPQLSQSVPTGEVLQPSDHFCGPPLDPLQQVHVFPVLRAPELDAGLQVGSHQSGVEGQNHLPRPAGYISFDAAQDMAGFLGCEHTLLARVQLFTHQYPQVLLCRASRNPFIPQPVLILGVALTQVQDLALGLVEPHEVRTGPLLELVQVPLDGIPSLRRVNCTTQLGVVCKFAEGALDPTVYVIDEDAPMSLFNSMLSKIW
ncbi:hypothetical protein QYF61_016854 [Mycteria americana]|uniref:Uncharacterized protein n=1 Tax=Mycteria americana TaxID=33587 RepID=A0AAN7MUM4_MYCAM|nr:hypothetical protein QYF61_016854 [Mycteria americana]